MSQMNTINENGTAFNGNYWPGFIGFFLFFLVCMCLGWVGVFCLSAVCIMDVLLDRSSMPGKMKEIFLALFLAIAVYAGCKVALQLGF